MPADDADDGGPDRRRRRTGVRRSAAAPRSSPSPSPPSWRRSAFLPAHALETSRTAADEPQYLLTAISLAEDHSLDLADELSAARWRDFAGHDLPRQTEPTPEGREISPHDPGLPLLLAAPVAIGGWIGAKVVLALVNGALAAVLLWTAVRRFGVSPRLAVPAVLALTLAPPLAVYGAQVYPELPGALCVAGIIAVGGAERRRFARRGRRRRPGHRRPRG